MSTAFNPYHEWLGLSRRITQPDFYQLLGIDESLTDVKAIAAAADRAASKVRSQRPGTHAAEWARLLDQIAAAKKCLTDQDQRRNYDQSRQSSKGNQAPSKVEATLAAANPPSKSSPPAGAIPMSPMGVPYLQGVDDIGPRSAASSVPNPMAPVIPSHVGPFSTEPPPRHVPATHVPTPSIPSPMAPVAYPASILAPMTPVIPAGPTPYPAMHIGPPSSAPPSPPMVGPATSVPPISDPLTTAPSPMLQIPQGPVAGSPLSINPGPVGNAGPIAPLVVANTAWEQGQTQRRDRSGLMGPIVVGIGVGLVLLSMIAVGSYMKSQSANREVAGGDNGANGGISENSNGAADPAGGQQNPPPENDGNSATDDKKDPQITPNRESISGANESKPDESPKPAPADAQPAMPAKSSEPEPKPMPEMKPATESKPMPETKPATAAETKPEPTPESKKLSKEDLVKLGRALQKAREAINERDFDRAQELLTLAEGMAKDTPHQPKLDRLRLLHDSVRQYHEAILTSISKLEVGVTFEIGGSTVGVVEAARDKIVLRVAGQNRTYRTEELPLGLAAALAEQTLAPTNPTNILFKWAYVIASPKASKEELEKARRYFDEASASDEGAKSIQLILSDKYDLAKDTETG